MQSTLWTGVTALSRSVFGICTILWVLAAGSSAAIAQGGAKPPAANGEVVQLRQRVEQLEEQLVDIQVTIGTLETLARSGATGGIGQAAPINNRQLAPSPGGQTGDQSARIAALETQIRALTAQVEQLSRPGAAANTARQPSAGQQQLSGQQATAAWQANGRETPAAAPSAGQGFGATTIQPRSSDRIGNLLQQDRTAALGSSQLPPVSADEDPQQKYEAAYGLLLQQEYGAAQQAFADFVGKYPKHPLAGNAQYWLGESHYVRVRYKDAAGAFLAGYRKFNASAKAPDSLLKLAMSLDRLGQKTAACSSLGELGAKFPSAPAHVKRRALQERRRLRCN